MGGVSILCLLFVLSMCLHVQKMRLKYKSAIRSLEEGNNGGDGDEGDEGDDGDGDDDDNGDDDDDEAKKSLKKGKRKAKKKKKEKKPKGFFVMLGLGNGPQHVGIKK